MPPFLRKNWTYIVLVLIMLVAGFLRLSKPDFDQNTSQHPDERFVSDVTENRLRWPSNVTLADILNPETSPLNLRISHALDSAGQAVDYHYGTLPVYMVKLAGITFMQGDIGQSAYNGYTLIGRKMAGVFDLITVFLVFLIARRLYGKNAGLLAAALSALAVTQIQIAHFYISEPFLVTFMTATLYFSVVLMQNRKWWAAALAGLMLGLAIACKVSVAPLALVIVAALVLRAVYRRRTRKLGPPAELDDPYGLTPASTSEREPELRDALASNFLLLVLAGVMSVVGVLIGDPFALLDSGLGVTLDPNAVINGNAFFTLGNFQIFAESGKYLYQLGSEAAIQKGISNVPFTLQYVGRTPFLDNIQQVVTWGLGLPVGIVAIIGVIVGIVLALRGRAAEILLVSGIVPYYLSIATFEAKWMRYMLPLVPYMCILAAALLARGLAWSLAKQDTRDRLKANLRRWAFPVLTVFTVLCAGLWATAFYSIYTKDHSRVTARAWAAQNIPPDATVSHEGWDDSIPAGHDVEFSLYDFHQSSDEFDYIEGMLNQLDYIGITSNRLYLSIPRLPWRYPVQIKYYQLLFAGKLGFEKVYESTSYPTIFGIQINDDYADESFTVYDHPKVMIFKKTRTLSDAELRTLFGDVINRPAFDLRQFPNYTEDKSIMLPQPVGEQVGVGDYAWNPLADNQWVALVLFLIAAEVIGLLAWPVAAVVGRRLPDRGWPLAKLIGILLVAWPVWILASFRLVPFTVWSVLFGVVLLAILSYLLWLRFGAELREVWRQQRRLILAWEALFLVAFAFFTLVRLLNPDLWQPWNGGEKPMEFGFLNAVYRSPWMPAYDPFFSSGSLNYYYYGYFLLAMLMKIVGVAPAVGFNIAVPFLYGLLALAAASVVYNVVATIQRARGWHSPFSATAFGFGVLGVVLTQFIGNLSFMLQFISIQLPGLQTALVNFISRFGAVPTALATTYQSYDWWGASRITGKTGSVTINEFPLWSFDFADLHPHLINMSFTLLVAGLGFSLLLGAWRWPVFRSLPVSLIDTPVDPFPTPRGLLKGKARWPLLGAAVEATLRLWGSEIPDAILRFAVTALALGTLFMINSWDFVTYAGLMLGVLLVVALFSWTVAPARNGTVRLALAIAAAVSLVAVAGVSLALYLPFFISFKALYTDIKTITDPSLRTNLDAFMVVWGLFIFITFSYLVLKLKQYPWRDGLEDIRGWLSLPSSNPSPAPVTVSPTPLGAQSTLEAPPAVVQRTSRRVPLALSNGNGHDDYSLDAEPSFEAAAERLHLPSNGNGYEHSDGMEEGETADTAPARSLSLDDESREPTFVARVPPPSDDSAPVEAANHAVVENLSYDAPHSYHSPVEDEAPPSHVLVEDVPYEAPPSHVVVEDVPYEAPPAKPARPFRKLNGLLPAGVGIVLMGITALATLVLLVTGSALLAMLTLLIGGLIGTHFGSVRNPGSLFGGLLLVTACIVVMGVELVYLADHLAGGDAFRMNTVFKFYVQAWVLFATGGAIAIYWIVGPKGVRRTELAAESIAVPVAAEAVTAPLAAPVVASVPAPEPVPTWDTPEGAEIADHIEESGSIEHEPDEVQVVEVEETDPDTPAEPTLEPVALTPTRPISTLPTRRHVLTAPAPEAAPVITPADPGPVHIAKPQVLWTWQRVVWAPLFAILLLGSLIFTVAGTQARVADRMPGERPPFGTLDGSDWMKYTALPLDFQDGQFHATVVYKFELEALDWLNKNIKGTPVIAEAPREYYREGGMIVGTYTGLPIVVGGLHQDEQRYGWQVGERRGDMQTFYGQDDVSQALTIISKYDIEYIYVGQIERAIYTSSGGLQKFDDLTQSGPNGKPVLEVAFSNDVVKIYHVLPDVEASVGGAPGTIRVEPTPRPRPTDPALEDDPQLKVLQAAVDADPGNFDTRLGLAEYYRDHGALDKAAEQYEAVIKIRPNNVAAHHVLGDIYMELGEKDKALQVYQEAADNADPGDKAAAYNKIGIAQRDTGHYDEAIADFQQAIQADAQFVEASYQLGSTYELLQDKDKAVAAYQYVLDHARDDDSGNSWKQQAQERLDAIR